MDFPVDIPFQLWLVLLGFISQVDKRILCITLVLGLTSDEDKILRSAAIRALGVYILYPCLREVSYLMSSSVVCVYDMAHTCMCILL